MDLLLDNELIDIPPFSLSSNTFIHPLFSFKDGLSAIEFETIEMLDDVLIWSDDIFVEFSFPYSFKSNYRCTSTSGAFTKRDVIDFLRNSFAEHFRSSPSPAFVWERSLIKGFSSGTTDYHITYPFRGMFASSASYNRSSKLISLNVECFPFVDDQVNLPF